MPTAAPSPQAAADHPADHPADLLLSSGFLAFARHLGVLRAIEGRGVVVDAVVGTSSGALIGALWAAGHGADALIEDLQSLRPIKLMRPHLRPWRGLFALHPLLAFLRQRLPATFDELPRPLAVGVATRGGGHRLLSAGPLPEAVVASCSMPYVFEPTCIAGERFVDGGAADRLAIGPLRRWRNPTRVIAHRVRRTAGKDLQDDLSRALVIETPPSGASFFSLGDFIRQAQEAETVALSALASWP